MADDPVFGLTRRDIEILKRIIASYENRPVNPPQRPTFPVDTVYNDVSATPEAYIAFARESIPAATSGTGTGSGTGDDPRYLSYVECDVYEVNESDGLLLPVAGLTRYVYNLSGTAVPAMSWIFPQRDKYGSWVVESSADQSTDLPLGCYLIYDGDGNLTIDVAALAGDGLSYSIPEGEDCNRLKVALGECGIVFNGFGQVVLNLTDVAQDGLYWDNDLCVLGIDFGCGLTLIGGQLAVLNTDLVGLPEDTSLVVGVGDCEIAFDKTIASTVPITYVTDVSLFISGGSLVLNVVKQTITDRYNPAGVIVDRTYGTPSDADFAIDPCTLIECCDAYELSVTIDAALSEGGDPYRSLAGLSPSTFYFTAVPFGGVAPYTYAWDYDDGDTDTGESVSHAFTTLDTYLVRVTVTDACDSTATMLIPVAIVEPPPCGVCVRCDDLGGPWGYQVTIAGSTGEFAQFNGIWMLPWNGLDEACAYGAILDDPDDPSFTQINVALLPSEGATAVLEFNSEDGTLVSYEGGTDPSCCDIGEPTPGAGAMDLDTQTGSGTPDSQVTVSVLGECNCPVTVCGCDVPRTLYLHGVTCACAGASIALHYDAAGADGEGWYSDTIADCDPGNHTLYFVWYCEAGDWKLDEVCDGVHFTGDTDTPGEGCPVDFPCAGTTPGSGFCCDLASTWTISATP